MSWTRLASTLLLGSLCSSVAIGAPTEQQAEQRAAMIVSRMTRAEKLRYVHGLFPPNSVERPTDMIPSAGYVPGVPRLGIPTLRESDASLGVANQVEQRKGDVATALPASLALAASFDPALAFRSGAMIGGEARAKTFNVLLAGGVNLTRDSWGGRNFEYLGEDPLLAGVMAGESIRGVQSNSIVSTIKHYVLNPQETGRNVLDAQIDEASLRESDLLAFQIAIERGRPGSVMCSYNKVNGNYACESDFLLNQVLKRDWRYAGWVMSDWGAVHSTARAALAGLDQESGQELDDQIYFGAPLARAVAEQTVPERKLDDMVRRILVGTITTGLFGNPVPLAPQPIDYAVNARVAQDVAEAGIVLLKNEHGLLPLAKTAKHVVLIGAHADVGVLSGGGSSQVRSVGGVPIEMTLTKGMAASFARRTWHASSPLAAIRALLPGADVRYVSGDDPEAAAKAAHEADVAIVFAWQWRTEAQDIETLSLPDNQDALINAVIAANPRTALVLQTGGAVAMPWLDRVSAVVEAWYPGQRGGEAIARILFGEINPSGRLPITFPRHAAQAPRPGIPGLRNLRAIEARRAAGDKTNYGMSGGVEPFAVSYVEGANVGYRWYEKRGLRPLFPFGYGLSYTQFRYARLTATSGSSPTIAFDVTNIGDRPGVDVPQVYVVAGRRVGTSLRLIGWGRVDLAPGETRRVTVKVDPRLIADYDVTQPGWHIAAGSYPVLVGRFAGDRSLSTMLKLPDRRLAP